MRTVYATALYKDDDATLDDLHEAVTMLEDVELISRRVFGGAHPTTVGIRRDLRDARAAVHAHKLRTLEAELAHDIYDATLVSDADAWAARRELYLELYRACELAGVPTFITPPSGCGEDDYDLRAELSG